MSTQPSRETVLRGLAASVAAGGSVASVSPAWATSAATPSSGDWAAFDRSVQSAFDRMNVVGAAVAVVSADQAMHTVTFGNRTQPIDPRTVEPFLGTYEAGYTVTRSGRRLQVQVGPRTFPLEALPDGSYAIGGGLIVILPMRFAREPDGIVHMELVGLETVRRTNGLAP